MNRRNFWLLLLGVVVLVLLAGLGVLYTKFGRQVNLVGVVAKGEEEQIQLPDGFTAQIFARDLNGPRFIAFSPDGILHVADRGKIVLFLYLTQMVMVWLTKSGWLPRTWKARTAWFFTMMPYIPACPRA